jgi:site-specific recombinase XerC
MQYTDIETAIDLFLEDRTQRVADSTHSNDESALTPFRQWCTQQGIEHIDDLTIERLHEYRLHRRGEVAPTTLYSRFVTIRQFVRFCEGIGAIENGLADRMLLPPRTKRARDEHVDTDTVSELLEYCERFRYAHRDHVIARLVWVAGLRTCTLHALDCGHIDTDECELLLRHQPGDGTRLKNGYDSERLVALDDDTAEILDWYIRKHRHSTDTTNDRRPLLTTRQGNRASSETIQRTVYRLTRPCVYDDACPHDRDPDDCVAAEQASTASQCPSSEGPHALRRGAITYWLEHVPDEAVSGRMDVSPDVLAEHYDTRDERAKMRSRADFFT